MVRTVRDEEWMQLALELADEAEALGEVPIGAVVVKEGQLLGTGYNRKETDQNPLAHAELLAIEAAAKKLGSWRLIGCDLYVTLEPCPMCAGALVQARLRRVVYGTEDPKAGYVSSLFNLVQDERLNHQLDVVAGVRRDECRQRLQTFFRRLREQKKRS